MTDIIAEQEEASVRDSELWNGAILGAFFVATGIAVIVYAFASGRAEELAVTLGLMAIAIVEGLWMMGMFGGILWENRPLRR